VLCGGKAHTVGPEEAHALADRIPAASLERYPDAGHLVVLKRAQQITAAVIRFTLESSTAFSDPPITSRRNHALKTHPSALLRPNLHRSVSRAWASPRPLEGVACGGGTPARFLVEVTLASVAGCRASGTLDDEFRALAASSSLSGHDEEVHSMATFVLIHGAGDVGWYWHLVEAELRRRGHDVAAPDLPCDDNAASLDDYADTVVDAIGGRGNLVVAGHSYGGFTAPLVADRVPVDVLDLVAGMVPAPGESPAEWWKNTGHVDACKLSATAGRPAATTRSSTSTTTCLALSPKKHSAKNAVNPRPPTTPHGRSPRGRTCRQGSC
jgi:pimeloyl-ACP methyl ester carboxylesterase